MMRVLSSFILSTGLLALMGCSAVKTPITNQYQLSAYSTKQYAAKSRSLSLFVNAPEAVAGYQTEQMVYSRTPYLIESFAKNSWVTPPADMLYPLLVNSLQRSGYFYAIASSPSSATTDYRLDTQLLTLEQNFLQKPSFIDFSAKLILTHVADNKVLASRIITLKVPCQTDSPYGGVVAANQAAQQFTALTTKFVISHLS